MDVAGVDGVVDDAVLVKLVVLDRHLDLVKPVLRPERFHNTQNIRVNFFFSEISKDQQ